MCGWRVPLRDESASVSWLRSDAPERSFVCEGGYCWVTTFPVWSRCTEPQFPAAQFPHPHEVKIQPLRRALAKGHPRRMGRDVDQSRPFNENASTVFLAMITICPKASAADC